MGTKVHDSTVDMKMAQEDVYLHTSHAFCGTMCTGPFWLRSNISRLLR